MASSKEAPLPPRSTGRRVLIVVGVVLLSGLAATALGIGFIFWSIWSFQEAGDAKNVDKVEESFLANPEGFQSAAAYMAQLADLERSATRISWTSVSVCVTDESATETCRDTTSDEEASQVAIPGADVVLWYARDEGRVLFAFKDDELDTVFLMFDPQARDAEAFAKVRGLSWERNLADGWSNLGSISDIEKYEAP
ncbi:hypothetical protein [Demequina aurantiaca]|uniref:hypothetical protein n=1 Tax=Demequina aurantiaca TaxID=676200 RepID=UPI003D357FEA